MDCNQCTVWKGINQAATKLYSKWKEYCIQFRAGPIVKGNRLSKVCSPSDHQWVIESNGNEITDFFPGWDNCLLTTPFWTQRPWNKHFFEIDVQVIQGSACRDVEILPCYKGENIFIPINGSTVMICASINTVRTTLFSIGWASWNG